MFPEEIPRRLIKMFSFVGDTVLDPFIGSGTTTLAARNLGRNSTGYEINADYIPVIKEKLGLKNKGFFDDKVNIQFSINREDEIDWKEEITKLPYIFKDPVKFDKKIDPRKLQFGSKVSNSSHNREEYCRVKEVVSPEELIVGDGLRIRLLGVKEKPEKHREAIEFLREKTNGQNVFLKFDTVKHDDNNHLFCYLYLQNKTFLNAHLIKRRLAEVDTSLNYKYKQRFLLTSRGY